MLALLAGAHMFQNRVNGFIPSVGGSFMPGVFPTVRESEPAPQAPTGVQIVAIYQAAMQRAIEDHEMDKLFNPNFYGYEI